MSQILGGVHGRGFRWHALIVFHGNTVRQKQLFSVLGVKLRSLNGRAHEFGMVLGYRRRPFLQQIPKSAEWQDDLIAPRGYLFQKLGKAGSRETPAPPLSNPQTVEQNVHVGAVALLKRETSFGDARLGVSMYGEIPERIVGKRQIHPQLFRSAPILGKRDRTPISAILTWNNVSWSDGVGMDDRDLAELKHKLEDLRTAHRDLDDSIEALIKAGSRDQLQLQRLKKRKLALKDDIARLENALVPDIIA